MSVETPRYPLQHPEIHSFFANWTGKFQEQFVEELASYSLETKRIPDPYHFEITANGELFSPTAHCKVKDKIEDKTGPLGSLEYQVLLSIEQWAAKSSKGSIAWISPPHPEIYPTTKIIISQIEYQNGVKRLFNRAIILDFDENKCLEFAQSLAQFSQNRPLLAHLDQIRVTPLILNTRISWIHILGELIDDPLLWETIRNGEDQRAKQEALRQARVVQKQFSITHDYRYSDEATMAVMQMLGPKSGSCPVVFKSTAFGVVAGSSLTVGSSGFSESDSKGSLYFPCPACGTMNKRPREGYAERCQNPGCPSPEAVRC